MGIVRRIRTLFSRGSSEGKASTDDPHLDDFSPASNGHGRHELDSLEAGVSSPLEAKNNGTVDGGSSLAGSFNHGATNDRIQWSSPTEFLLTCIGFSVGLGNVWRFPYLCYKNGGGAFLIPYTLMIITIGIPLLFMEYASGQYFGIGSLSLFKTVCPMFKGLGVSYFVLNCLVTIYYNVIIALSLYYIFSSFTTVLPWSHCNNTFNSIDCGDPVGNREEESEINTNTTLPTTVTTTETAWLGGASHNYTEITVITNSTSPSEEFFRFSVMGEGWDQSIGNIGAVQWKLCLCLLLAWILVAIFVSKGIKSSGKVSYITATFPYVMLTVLVVRGVTLEGSLDGIIYFIVPQWSRLLDAEVWFQAAIQMFYALNLAWGGMITMSSYNQLNHNCYRDAIVINLVSFGTSLYAGVAVFAIIGYMAKEQKIAIEEVIKTGPGLAFVAYPRALSLMPAAPLFSVAFFFMLFLLGVGSQMVCVETIITGIMDKWHYLVTKWQYRVGVIAVVSTILFLFGIPCTTQGGMYVLQLMDHYAAGFSVLIIAIFECFVINWVYGHNRFKAHIYEMMKYSLNVYYSICWKFLSPILIIIITVFSFVNYKPVEYGPIPYPTWAELLGWSMALTSTVPIILVALYSFLRAKGKTLREKLKNATSTETDSTIQHDEVQEGALPLCTLSTNIVEESGNLNDEQLSVKPVVTTKSKLKPFSKIDSYTNSILGRKLFDRTVNICEDTGSEETRN